MRTNSALISEDADNAFEVTGIPSIKATLKTAQENFEAWIAETNKMGGQESLSDRLSADFFLLLDRLTIARSRTQIREFYKHSEEQRFPSRKAPKSIFPEIDREGKFPSYQEISDQIDGYKLSLFNPSRYIREECRHHYSEELLQQREFNLIGMMKVNFLKRLESSIYSFTTTLERTLTKIGKLESDIHKFSNPTESNANQANFNPFVEAEKEYEEDEESQDVIQVGKNQTYPYKHLDLDAWLKDLGDDKARLGKIHRIAQNITSDRDAKLEDLKQLIKTKVQNPTQDRFGEENRKVIVFTAFADTANYLYDKLYTWATNTLGIHVAVVTGGANKTSFGGNDFNEILTNFSPISKERKSLEGDDQETEIDLLIATDCISEGQNLQDCDYLVNYDIHWNPVRIIQRFGRIDRLKSRNEKIQLVNFWPTPELEAYINLKTRVEARMALVDMTATGDDDLLSLNKDKEVESMKQVSKHRYEQLRRMQDENLNFEDIEEQVNINQFTLDDFRAQLLHYLRGEKDELEKAPLGLYAVTAPQTSDGKNVDIEPGVIFCLKQTSETKENEKLNPIYPYYLVHVSDEGKVSIGFTNPKRILEHFSALCIRKESPCQDLCDWFNTETANGSEMTFYKMLIDEALESIRYHYDEKLNREFRSNSQFLIPTADEQVGEATEFELITWLVIRKKGD